ncbi:MAG: hypothetical protein M3441_05740 [Chloroflexota bacterium]|nr:hypothetical protein [Chloroflexota bacterium]
MKRVSIGLVGILLLGVCGAAFSRVAYSQARLPSWPDAWVADSAFLDVWVRSDGPVALKVAGRSWLWGPVPFAVANEAYTESPTGKRLVEYLDKGRMEVNDPAADRASNWFVTGGLLVTEMVSGQMQTGNSTFEKRAPAEVPVAGDMGSPDAPTYATFSGLLGPVPRANAGLASQLVSKDGSVRPLEGAVPGAGRSASTLGTYDEVSGHNVPAVFTEWMAQTGAVLQGGRLAQGRLMDPLFVLGRPITEAYWADVLVAGAPARVLVQLFERRSLTYNPANPPQWQVEMANVGRAYSDWRYGGAAPDPAISAQVTPNGVQVRGWNWSPGGLSLHVGLTEGGNVAGPFGALADQSGMFHVVLSEHQPLEEALISGAKLFVAADGGDRHTAIPLAGKIPVGDITVEGTLTGVQRGKSNFHSVLLRDDAGKEWKVVVGSDAPVSYSEGSEAKIAQVASGEYARVEGRQRDGQFYASKIRIMSLSRTGARLGYELLPNGRGIRVSGTRWPASSSVTLSIRPFSGEGGVQIGTTRSDSRGNVSASFAMPPTTASEESLWLFAQLVNGNSLVAQVAVLYSPELSAEEARNVPALILLSHNGEQMGGTGSYCDDEACLETAEVPMPGDNLLTNPTEVLRLRSQVGFDPEMGPTPERFAARLYLYPAAPAREGVTIGGTFYFSPKSLPIFSTGDVPGRPFSIPLPQTTRPGKYLLLVSVVWSEGAGQREEAVYGFALEVPPQDLPLSR